MRVSFKNYMLRDNRAGAHIDENVKLHLRHLGNSIRLRDCARHLSRNSRTNDSVLQ